MAKIYTGTYGKDTTDETALVTNLLKYPEIGKKLISQYPRFSLTYLLEAAGRNAAEKIIGDYAFEWKMMGRYRKPSLSNGTQTMAGTNAGDSFTCILDHSTAAGIYGNQLNVNDIVRFPSGATAMVTDAGTPGAGTGDVSNTITLRAIDSVTDVLAAGDVIGCIGNAFNQGSLASEVGQNYAYPDTYKNWLTLSRKKTKIMGSDLTDVTWIESNGHRLWYFTKEQQMTDQFMYELEAQRWYGKKTVGSPAGYPGDTGIDNDVTAGLPVMGDGLLAQIDGSNQATYTAGALTEEDIVNFIGTLSKNALSAEGNVWTVFTGTQGRIDFHRAMKDLLVSGGAGGAGLFASKGGAPVSLGANFSEYNILGNKMILSYCPVFDDPNMHNSISSTFDSSNESGKMVFVDMGMQNGVSNVELIAKGAEGFNRSFVKKYVPGMVNPYDYNSMMAANGDDFFECQILSESGIILRNPLSCGILSNS
tara:strand:- start:2531 stop:3961 length:1431 start_codon:yes stop_codon:yes gene_type:complete